MSSHSKCDCFGTAALLHTTLPLFGLHSVILTGKSLSRNCQIWPPFRETNEHRCSFPFLQTVYISQIPSPEERDAFFHVLMARRDHSLLWQTHISNTNDTPSHKAPGSDTLPGLRAHYVITPPLTPSLGKHSQPH